MIRKSRLVGALGLTLALGVSGIAFGTAATNNAQVLGKVSPKKLDKKKRKPVNLYLGVANSPEIVNGSQSNPAVENISIGKNVKVSLNKADACSAPLVNGSTTAQARAMCPPKSYLGSGRAVVTLPNKNQISDLVVSVFAGGGNLVRLHTYSPTLQAGSPIVNGNIVKSTAGSKYGQALSVNPAPETGALMITHFDATISKSSKVATANCQSKTIPFLRKVTYKDGTSETVSLKQKCKRKAS